MSSNPPLHKVANYVNTVVITHSVPPGITQHHSASLCITHGITLHQLGITLHHSAYRTVDIAGAVGSTRR